jgi:hypothetical protein
MTYIYLTIGLYTISSFFGFSSGFQVFLEIAKSVWTRHVHPLAWTYPIDQTCPASSPDITSSQAKGYIYIGDWVPHRTLGLLFLFHFISCGSKASLRRFWIFSVTSCVPKTLIKVISNLLGTNMILNPKVEFKIKLRLQTINKSNQIQPSREIQILGPYLLGIYFS